MIIALDYDDTFTKDPSGWLDFAYLMRNRGHEVFGVTFRYDFESDGMSELYLQACDKIYFTGRQAKQEFMLGRGISIDVWIDDNPLYILTSL